MHRILIALPIACLLSQSVLFGGGKTDDAKALEGTWVPAEAELAGGKFPEDLLKTMSLTMSAGNYTVKVGDVLDKGTYKIDPNAKPKTIDITGTEGPNRGKTLLAIYELTGDTLRVCYDLDGKNRPAEFKTQKNSKQFLATYNRGK